MWLENSIKRVDLFRLLNKELGDIMYGLLTHDSLHSSLYLPWNAIATPIRSAAMRLLPLLVFFHKGLAALNCTTGYVDDGNGNCQSTNFPTTSQFSAYSVCASNNGYMLSIQNAFENSNVNTLSGGSFLWLGLTCTDSTKTSCAWDTGVAITNGSYTNFAPGHPNTTIGACVYFNPTNNMWYSSSCGSNYNFICRITPGINVPSCPSPSYYFRGNCYYTVNELERANADNQCDANCAAVASIHNPGENSYVRDLSLLKTPQTLYTYIGLSCDADGCQWSDKSDYNYQAFGHRDYNLGTCVFLATSTNDDIVRQGQWVSGDCFENGVTVCKKNLVCPIPTQTPEQCTDVQYLSGTGQIESPGYPRGSVKNHCQYVVTQTAGYGISLYFPELNLDTGSTINIFNSIMDTVPFATLTNASIANNTIFYSAENLLRIVFNTPGSSVFKNSWSGRFDQYKSGANNCGGTYTTPGTIAGPNHAQNCTYTLKMGGQRTCLMFAYYGMLLGDYVSIYDGGIVSGNRIAYLSNSSSGYLQRLPPLCSSTSNYLTLSTSSLTGLSYEMFTIIAADSPDLLKGNIYGSNYYDRSVPLINFVFSDYSSADSNRFIAGIGQRVNAVFSQIRMYNPDSFAILDGSYDSNVALAYGNPTRMIYQSSQQYLTVVAYCYQRYNYASTFTGNFTAI